MNANNICNDALFDRLYLDYAKTLHNLLYYRCGNQTLAEDLTQEAFLRLWKNCHKVPPEKARGFVFTTALNLLRDEYKHQAVVLKFQQIPRKQSSNYSPHSELEEKEFKAKLERAINQLPENNRIVFLLNRIDKRSYREIAEMLGISVKAVEKRMQKALVEMRKISKNI
ncbi:MAG: sigma-70 family RNA polymerase sigma factor [Bacteroidota bacterium]